MATKIRIIRCNFFFFVTRKSCTHTCIQKKFVPTLSFFFSLIFFLWNIIFTLFILLWFYFISLCKISSIFSNFFAASGFFSWEITILAFFKLKRNHLFPILFDSFFEYLDSFLLVKGKKGITVRRTYCSKIYNKILTYFQDNKIKWESS